MKKNLSLIVVFSMLLSLFTFAAHAEKTDGLENAILSVKSRIEITDEYSEFDSDIFNDEDITSYRLSWNTPYEEYSDNKHISVQVNDKGDITNFGSYENSYNSDEREAHFTPFSDEDLKGIAAEWLRGINPSWMPDLPEEYITLPAYKGVYDTDTFVMFNRYVNGLPFCGNYVSVCVDNQSGKITDMYSNWTYADSIPSADTAMAEEDAEKILLENSALTLQYIYSSEEGKAILVYRPLKDYSVNAATGKEFVPFSRYYSEGYATKNSSAEDAAVPMAGSGGGAPRLSESEIKNIDQISGLLTQDILRSIAENLKNTDIGNMNFTSCLYQSYKKSDSDETMYNAYLRYENEDEEASVSLDALTGELLSYNSYSKKYYLDSYTEEDKKEAAADPEKSKNTAKEFVYEYSNISEENLRLDEQNSSQDSRYDYSYTFNRYENGYMYGDNSVSVNVDKNTGSITRYYKFWDKDLTFETPDNLISAADAEKLFTEKVGLCLTYEKEQGESKTKPVISLKYSFSSDRPNILSAKTGELLSYGGGVYVPGEEETVYPDDISGHYAEVMIKKLIDTGILKLEDEKSFRPDEVITQRDLLAFVSGLKIGYIPYYENDDFILRAAGNYGIIRKSVNNVVLSDDATREMGASFIVKAIGYGRVAELKGIFTTGFEDDSDISEDAKGSVAIAKGLGVVSGDENNRFNPNDKLTRADAAIMIYNYLAN